MLELLLDNPTIAESVPGYEASTWVRLGAPAHAPAGIVDRLNGEIDAGGADPKLKASFADTGGIVLGGSPTDFGTMLAAEVEKWGKVVKFAGIKPKGDPATPTDVLRYGKPFCPRSQQPFAIW